MPRKAISEQVITGVLRSSRRRCCICFGLNRDTSLKAGQIAHLDQDSANSAEDNLAFLCLEHHDEFDSRTSQRKGLTRGEVKAYRSELYQALGEVLKMPVHFGVVTLPAADPYAGVWIRVGDGDVESAEVTLTPVSDGLDGAPRYAITGFALWGRRREYGPNMGDFSIVAAMEDGVIEHHETHPGDGEEYSIVMRFEGDELTINECGWVGRYGMNVHFMGEYRRAR
jgi:hypothetical protein